MMNRVKRYGCLFLVRMFLAGSFFTFCILQITNVCADSNKQFGDLRCIAKTNYGELVKGVVLEIYYKGDRLILEQPTNQTGQASFSNLGAGFYKVKVFPPEGYSIYGNRNYFIAQIIPGKVEEKEILLRKHGIISGRIKNLPQERGVCFFVFTLPAGVEFSLKLVEVLDFDEVWRMEELAEGVVVTPVEEDSYKVHSLWPGEYSLYLGCVSPVNYSAGFLVFRKIKEDIILKDGEKFDAGEYDFGNDFGMIIGEYSMRGEEGYGVIVNSKNEIVSIFYCKYSSAYSVKYLPADTYRILFLCSYNEHYIKKKTFSLRQGESKVVNFPVFSKLDNSSGSTIKKGVITGKVKNLPKDDRCQFLVFSQPADVFFNIKVIEDFYGKEKVEDNSDILEGRWSFVNSDSSYRIDGLAAGRYNLYLIRLQPNYSDYPILNFYRIAKDVEVNEGTEMPVEVEEYDYGSEFCEIIGECKGFQAILVIDSNDEVVAFQELETGIFPRYLIKYLLPGEYTLLFLADDEYLGTKRVTLKQGEVKDVNYLRGEITKIHFPEKQELVGVVMDERGNLLSGVTVKMLNYDYNKRLFCLQDTIETNQYGQYRFYNVSDDSILIEFDKKGFVGLQKRMNLISNEIKIFDVVLCEGDGKEIREKIYGPGYTLTFWDKSCEVKVEFYDNLYEKEIRLLKTSEFFPLDTPAKKLNWVYRFFPEGLSLAKEAQVKIYYKDEDIKTLKEENLQLVEWTGREWKVVDTKRDMDENEFRFKTKRLSTYAIFELEPLRLKSAVSLKVFPQPWNCSESKSCIISGLPLNLDRLLIYNLAGELVKNFSKRNFIPVENSLSVSWNGRNNDGKRVACGVYIFIGHSTDDKIFKGKIVVMR